MANLPAIKNNAIHDGSETIWLNNGNVLLLIGNETDGDKVGAILLDADENLIAKYAIVKPLKAEVIDNQYVEGFELEGGRALKFIKTYVGDNYYPTTLVDFPTA